MFIHQEYIESLLAAPAPTHAEVVAILQKAREKKGLSHTEVAALLKLQDPAQLAALYAVAGEMKRAIYGNRVVIFAPLYISDYCVNDCAYCGYKHGNDFPRRKLTREQLQNEVRILQKMGHKRLAMEAGEDAANCDIDYVVDCIRTVYETAKDLGDIRRINVNIASTTVENYRKLKEAQIGTYILFQETYHKPTYETMHKKGPKANYEYHLTAFDRAMQAGIDDVGGGVLFGLYRPDFEVLGLMMHNEYLEKTYGVGFHTISVPRLKKAEGMALSHFPYLVDDDTFKKIVAVIRLAVPFTGIILSTRESAAMRKELLSYGVSQISAGSSPGVGAYQDAQEEKQEVQQFEVADHRTPCEVISSLMQDDYIPSYCTACYRQGRTGDRFMRLAKSGQIQYVCQPNALMTLQEYLCDYGTDELKAQGAVFIEAELEKIAREDVRELTRKNLQRIARGERDLFI